MVKRFLFWVCFVCLLGSITTASGRFPSFRLPNRGDIVPSGVFGVCLPSVYHHRFRSLSFVQATFTTTDSVCLHSFRLSNRGYVAILVALVLY